MFDYVKNHRSSRIGRKGKAKLVGAAVQSALDEGCEATEILNSMIDAMAVVGERFKNGEIFVPEMLVAAVQ